MSTSSRRGTEIRDDGGAAARARGAIKRRAFLLFCAWALGSAALPLHARADDDAKPSDAARERWQKLSPEQREKLRERHREFEKLPPEEQQRVRKNFERWQKLSPKKKEATRERYKRWRELAREARGAARALEEAHARGEEAASQATRRPQTQVRLK